MIPLRLAATSDAAALVLPVAAGAVPAAYAEAAALEGFSGKAQTCLAVFAPPGQVLLVGIGEPDAAAAEAAGALAVARCGRSPHLALDARGLAPEHAASFAAGAVMRAWRYDRLRTRPEEDAPRLAAIDLLTEDPAAHAAWARQSAAVTGACLARDLVTEPSDTLTPQGFVDRLAPLLDAGVTLQVLEPPALREAGFGGLLAVGQGSVHEPRLAVLRWAGAGQGATVAFVGKGITFDTGGICIKPADKMWEMRADMAGAAACVGAMLALALRRSPCPAIAVLPLAENAVGAASYRPGDVLTMFDRSTVEVIDTDAEGRLVLADALAFAVTRQPRAIIDAATLTGSIVTALGNRIAGLFCNDDALAAAVSRAGQAVGERVWRMPMAEGHEDALKSDIADRRHCSPERHQPDACQAACFLRGFVGDTPWAHLDIAGVDTEAEATDRHAKGASGFGARLLDRLVAEHFEA